MTENNIQISFIIPIYNTAPYLAECIESVLSQTHLSKEIILINDGSTDNSLEIALNYAKQYNFIIVVHSPNQGLSASRNKGIKLARGEYIYFLDSDDYLIKDCLYYAYELATQYNIDLVRLQAIKKIDIPYLQMPDARCQIEIIPPACPHVNNHNNYIMPSDEYFYYMLKDNYVPALCWTLIRRELIVENKLTFYENATAEDILFYVQLLTCREKIRVLETNHTIYNYRIRPNSITTQRNNIHFFLSHFTIINEIKKWQSTHLFSEEINAHIETVISYIYDWSTIHYFKLDEEYRQKYQSYYTPEIIERIQNKRNAKIS